MPKFTKGFVSASQLSDHFQKHKAEFSFSDEAEYQEAADEFLGGHLRAGTLEYCVPTGNGSKSGRILRYDPATNEFGIRTPDNYVLTFFKPQPMTGTGLDYFKRQC